MSQKCEVEGCTGTYQDIPISYVTLRRIRDEISVEEYNLLEDKKGYCAVVSQHCDVCNDDLDKRLVSFINENFK